MDFLDPAKKRARKIKLAVGHVLMGLVVLLGTYILVYQAYGFDVDRETGEVFQNGLVFIDSAPDGAEIKINGEVHKDQTNTRVAMPEGHYDLEINKDGYRTWRKSFDLEGGTVERFVYPTLFLNELEPNDLRSFNSSGFLTQSPDRRWVLISEKNKPYDFVEYDLNTLEAEKPSSRAFSLPDGLFESASGSHSLKLIEWSSDNKNLLVRHTFAGGFEYVVINREQPEESFSVNELFSKNFSNVLMHDKQIDRLNLYDGKGRTLSLGNTETAQLETVAEDVAAFEPHGRDVLVMAVRSPDDPKMLQVVIKEGDETHIVREMEAKKGVKLLIARYDNDWYMAAYDPSERRTFIYRNPVEYLETNPGILPPSVMVLGNIGPVDDLEFSQNTQFISARSGQKFSVYDNEYARAFRFEVPRPFDKGSEVVWMDGHRFLARSGGRLVVFEFDGQNQQMLISALSSLPVVFNRDYTELYMMRKSASEKIVFTQTQMRLEEDR